MKGTETPGKNGNRRPITSHTLNLQNFRLGDKYLIFDRIGSGKKSAIYYGVQQKTKLERVFKFYNLKEIEEVYGFKEKELCKRLSNYEFQVGKSCKSINILKCFDIYQDRNYKIFVYQFCQKSLQDEIQSREIKKISEIRAILILKQILSGLKYLHLGANILHTNLKAENILVQNGVYKLIDFGLPSLSENGQEQNYLRAPEIVSNKAFDQKVLLVLSRHKCGAQEYFFIKYYSELCRKLQSKKTKIYFPSHQMFLFMQTTANLSIHHQKQPISQNAASLMSLQELENHQMFQILQQGIQNRVQERKQQSSIIKEQVISQLALSVTIAINLDRQLDQQIQKQKLAPLFNEKLTMELFTQQIQKQLEKQYQRLGQSFEIQQLQKASLAHLRREVNKKEAEAYNQMKQYYLECLKVEFILNEILKPLLKSKNSKKQRFEVELFYLILSSSFSAISRLNLVKKDQKQASQYQNLLVNCIEKSTGILYRSVETLEKKYSQMLTKIQNGIKSILTDRFSKIFNQQQLKQKDLYLLGIQNIDFDPKDKIKFTLSFFRENKQRMISFRQKQKESDESVSRAFSYLQLYVKIWDISNENEIEEKYPTLKSYIDNNFVSKNKASRIYSSIQQL